MPAFAVYDETMRVPKQHFGPARTLPRSFAKDRPSYWPYVLIAVLMAVALATPVKVPDSAARSAQAHELLRSLGR